MTTNQDQLFDQIDAINAQIKAGQYSLSWEEMSILRYQREELKDELHEVYRQECVSEGEHMRQTVSDGGYDVCFNCGAKA